MLDHHALGYTYDTSAWCHNDLTTGVPGTLPIAIGDLTCFFDEPHTIRHVFDRGADSDIHELLWAFQL